MKPPFTFRWKRERNMPFGMGGPVQSVVIDDVVYVGGGYADQNDVRRECTVIRFKRGHWTKLPQYKTRFFAMTSYANQLVLVGGRDSKTSKMLGVFDSDNWTYPFPPMNNARESSTAVSHNNYIIVAGGISQRDWQTFTIEVLDVDSKKWYDAQSPPTPRTELKSQLIENTLYLMGGFEKIHSTIKIVHYVDLDDLIAKAIADEDEATPTLWQTTKETPLTLSAPLSVRGFLLAIGGLCDDFTASPLIYFYQPDTMTWVKLGRFPSARYNCTCAVLNRGEIIIAGGGDTTSLYNNKVDRMIIV